MGRERTSEVTVSQGSTVLSSEAAAERIMHSSVRLKRAWNQWGSNVGAVCMMETTEIPKKG